MNDDHRTPSPDEEATADRLRRTLHAVAAATPVSDRRAALLAAIDGSEPLGPTTEDDAMHLDARTDAPTPIWRRPLFLAAAAALLIAVAVGVLVGQGPDGAVELDPATPEDTVPATGWYLPPEGWEITEVRADFVDVGGEVGSCPCRSLIAAGNGGDAAPTFVVWETARPAVDFGDGEPVDVGGREGFVVDVGGVEGGLPSVAVGTAGAHVWIAGSGAVELADVVALADAWLDQVEAGEEVDPSALPLPDGVTAGAIVRSPALRSAHILDLTAVEEATGRTAYYQLGPAGSDLGSLILDADDRFRHDDGRFSFRTTIGSTPVAGLVGGTVDVTAGPSWFAEEGDLDGAEAAAFVAALRPADLDGWRAALAGARVEPEVLQAETLFGPPLVDTSVDG